VGLEVNKIAVVVLAAGSSSRMGQPKQLLKYKNTFLLDYCIQNALASNLGKVYVVLGAYRNEIKSQLNSENEDLIWLMNKNWQSGLSSSIKIGLEYAIYDSADAVLFLLGDQPEIEPKFLKVFSGLNGAFPAHIIASNYQKSFGIPALFPKVYFSELKKLSGDKGAKKIILNHLCQTISIPFSNLMDVDTPEDYQNLVDNKNPIS